MLLTACNCLKTWSVMLALGVAATTLISLCYRHDLRGSAPKLLEKTRLLSRPAADYYAMYHHPPQNGYVMALHYSDQMTASTLNLISLQCWAYSLGPRFLRPYVKVVEPFVRRSSLGFDDQHRIHVNVTVAPKDMKSVTLYDVYDASSWEEFTASHGGYAPIASWDDFLRHSPRKMIVVERKCMNYRGCMACGDERTQDLLRSIEVLQVRYGFEVVRKVCYPRRSMLNKEFRKIIYDSYAPHEVVVVFNYWGGIHKFTQWRVAVSDLKRCDRYESDATFHISLSKQLEHDALQYSRKHMSGARYITVMVRLEHYYLRHKSFMGLSRTGIVHLLEEFYGDIVKKVNEFRAKHNIDSVLLTMDCQRQGSSTFLSSNSGHSRKKKMMALMSDSAISLFKKLYGNSSTLEEWEESFYSVSSFRNEGYIAMLQKYLAARGDCLITAGGGTFQETAASLYNQYHHYWYRCIHAI